MRLDQTIPALPVGDASATDYRDRLGFSVRHRHDGFGVDPHHLDGNLLSIFGWSR